MSAKKSFLIGNKFTKHTFPITLAFKSEEMEEKYMVQRSQDNEYKRVVIISTFVSIWLLFILITYLYFSRLLDNLCLTNSSDITLLIAAMICLILLLLEMLAGIINCLRYFRGFFICLPLTCVFLYDSFLDTNSLESKIPIIPASFLAGYSIFISISFCICYNWISGCILQILVNLMFILFINFCSWDYIQKVFYSFFFALSLISILSTNRYFEYQRRISFLQSEYLRKEKEKGEKVLQILPDPILITKNKKIVFRNTSFENILQNEVTILGNNRREFSNELLGPITIGKLHNNFIITHLENLETKKTLKELIKGVHEIGQQNQFKLVLPQLKREIPFEINSKTLESNTEILYSLKSLSQYQLIQELKSKEKYSRTFVASVSHDFRTPINIIQGNLDSLTFSFELNFEQKKYVLNIKNASSILNLLVQDLLDFNLLKEKQFKINSTACNVKSILMEMVDLFLAKYHDKDLYLKLKFIHEINEFSYTDGMRIKQILMNLLSNAWKFTLQGGVTIEVSNIISKGQILIKVIDTGIGIDEADIPKLTKSFSKLEDKHNLNQNGKHKLGIGLGLNICKKIVKKLGGKLTIQSNLNHGSIFSFSFSTERDPTGMKNEHDSFIREPFQNNNSNNIEEIKEQPNFEIEFSSMHRDIDEKIQENSSRILVKCNCPKILIVDDEICNRDIISHYCRKLGILCEQAKNGVEALERVKTFNLRFKCCDKYNLILMDSNMPLMNGRESSLQIRDFFNNNSSPKIVCVTADAGYQELSSPDGRPTFDEITYKPLFYDTFSNLVKKYVNKHKF